MSKIKRLSLHNPNYKSDYPLPLQLFDLWNKVDELVIAVNKLLSKPKPQSKDNGGKDE